MRLVRSEMIDVLSTDYIRFAKARGLPLRYIHFRLALRNALMPVITVTGLQIGSLIAFAIVTETVFQWPGMGLLFIQAVSFVDIPVMAAYLLFVGSHVRRDQHGGRHPLRGGRSATAREVRMNTLASPGLVRRIGAPDLRDAGGAAGAGHHRLRPARSAGSRLTIRTDLATFELINAEIPPAFMADGDSRFCSGTDNQGRDLLSAMLYGARVSIAIGGGAVLLAATLGVFLGLLAGYFGGKVDALIMRIGDVILSFPTILLALLVSGIARALFPQAGDGRMGAAHPDLRHRDSRMGAICPHR